MKRSLKLREGVDRPIRVGLVFLAPEGWEIECEILRDLTELWAGAGPIDLQSLRLEADPAALDSTVRRWSGRDGIDVVGIVGRSGHRAVDFAPDVTRRLLHRSLPGIEERMYLASPRRPADLLFRGVAGIRNETVIINLPARAGRVRQILRFLAPVLRHCLEKIGGDEKECARP